MNLNLNETLKNVASSIREAFASPQNTDSLLAKNITQSTGLVWYDLQAGALQLYPVLTPFRNRTPRVPGNGGTATNWKAITAINSGNLDPYVSEGNRAGLVTTQVVSYTQPYAGIGLEDSVTFEASYAGQNYDDVRAIASMNLLRATMIQEERAMLSGNNSLALGVTPTPTAVGSITGGSLATASYNVFCVALTLMGSKASSVAGGVIKQYTRTNADSSTDTINPGNAGKSSAGAASVASGSSGSIAASVAPVNGAFAYAWYWGTAGNELLGAITSINSVSITATATGTQNISAMPAGDQSQNTLAYDGLITQIVKPGSNAYIATAATGTPGTGTKFTSDGAAGIAEFENAFASFWSNYKLSPDNGWMSGATLIAINKLIMANGGVPLYRYNLNDDTQQVSAGTVVKSYLNKITNTYVTLQVHPDLPDGVVLFTSDSIPYPLSGVGNVLQMRMRQDYYAIEFPRRSRRYEFGVYADGALQLYFPPAFGLLRNFSVT